MAQTVIVSAPVVARTQQLTATAANLGVIIIPAAIIIAPKDFA